MLFNSYTFLFFFLPVALGGFFLVGRYHTTAAAAWLLGASLVFYGMWNVAYVPLLLGSITFNYIVGVNLSRYAAGGQDLKAKWLIRFGITSNLLLLGYYKYANFFVSSTGALLGDPWQIEQIILPIGISFFTFTQIAFLVDAHRGEVKETNFIHYGLFVTYFPHLIAGPVLHHKEMMPQFANKLTYRPKWDQFAAGIAIFTIGLFKKVVIADGIAPYASPAFDAAAAGHALSMFEAWGGALAFSFQLYFDFSAYCDMAIGLSCLFGVRLPLNFNSPYKAVNIIEFWRRWHMTLSRFLRDYLYISLGGNRRGKWRRHLNLFITMVLGGLWHGAGWTFVAWGALHGLYLMVNHAWRSWRARQGDGLQTPTAAGRWLATGLTFVAVVIAWVFFRAANMPAAMTMIEAMAGLNGIPISTDDFTAYNHISSAPSKLLLALILCATVVWFFPNSQEILADHQPALASVTTNSRIRWRPTLLWTVLIALSLFKAILDMGQVSEFLYFQF
ncbi:MBOAT family protein [Hydrogenophaga sp. IBVHS1]|uniref:MBOAT family O-acyltransferase n=1 Tax=unclassified Hydrogenophaga TaxID=2610897 RepID=UPI000A2E4390|nr:MBOAT family O-acyltransferase [Hydrogenophaga sp. IBVHS1]OSZ73280.1 membrane-bound O-acyltransferase family protein [Hydrogenophaga sp. IBVHS1]